MLRRLKNFVHLGQSVVGKIMFNFTLDGMTFIGVTGTDGKTTTSNLLYHILTTSGEKTALISTISAVIDGKPLETGFHVTTPSSLKLQSYIKQAKKTGAKYIVLEVTSHALDQYRVFGIPFTIGVMTNITNEHLDYHKTYEKYVSTKVKLMQSAKIAVLNADDGSYPLVIQRLETAKYKGKIMTYSMLKSADVTNLTFPFQTKLIGEFNKYNTLAAVSACLALGIEPDHIRKAIETFTPPIGRTEIVHEGSFSVMIDFAHTPNSINQVLTSIRKELLKKGRIIHVFGSAGERDAYKRGEMGHASAQSADIIILTAEDPRSESVADINAAITTGIKEVEKKEKKSLQREEIPDRRQAIMRAIELAEKGDIVILTGKGHERGMNLGHGDIPWSEHEAVREALAWKGV